MFYEERKQATTNFFSLSELGYGLLHVHLTFLYISLPFFARLEHENPISCFMKDVNKQRRNFFLFLNLDMLPWNSTSGEFACILQSKWAGIIATKTERTQIHFLSDVLVAVTSLDLNREF